MSTLTEVIAKLDESQRSALAAKPELFARFEALLDEAVIAGPGQPGGCGRNPFWDRDSSGSELSGWRLFDRAEYEVGLAERGRRVAA